MKPVYQGIDLAKLARYLWSLDSMRAEKPVPAVAWRSHGGHGVGGTAWRTRVAMRVGADAPVEEVAEVLLHELVHCSCPSGEHHGPLFRRRLVACAREAFGVSVDPDAAKPVVDVVRHPETGEVLAKRHEKIRAYVLDEMVVAAMIAAGTGRREVLCARGFEAAPEPVEAPEDVAARRAARAAAKVAKRRAHVEEMAAAWERRARRAKAIAAKWRRAAKGYEVREARAARRNGGAP